MRVIPAIDIQEGKCVRLYQGDFDKRTEYSNDPFSVAKNYENQGTLSLHVVDLDGAKQGALMQESIACRIAKQCAFEVQMGGGIRTQGQVAHLLNQGITRVVVGSMSVTQPEEVKSWLEIFGPEKMVLALDVKLDKQNEPFLVTQGWQQETMKTLWSLLDAYQASGLKYVLCTDIARDGVLMGPNLSLYENCQKRYPHLCWQASGGIGELSHLTELKSLNLYGVVIGKALYEKKFTLKEAMQTVATC